jgi:hypothetical protein
MLGRIFSTLSFCFYSEVYSSGELKNIFGTPLPSLCRPISTYGVVNEPPHPEGRGIKPDFRIKKECFYLRGGIGPNNVNHFYMSFDFYLKMSYKYIEVFMATDDEKIEMENIFFNEVEKGERPYKLTEIYNQVDLMFLKSLFQSEQIPYKMEFEHGSALYAGTSIIETAVYVLEKDKADALKILEEYNKSKSN